MLVGLIAATFMALLVVPAFAQARDPFDPLVTQENAGTTTVDTTGDTTTDTTQDPVFQENGSDGLPDTGSDPSAWLVAAYGLVVLGVAAIVLARISHPSYLLRR